MKNLHILTASFLVGGALFGCASQNYEFAGLPEGQTRIDCLVEDLEEMSLKSNEAEDLYDFSVFPLVHSRLHLFEVSDDESAPAGYVEADVESSFPLFGFVDGEVSHYDQQRRLITRHEFGSALWGAFSDHRETVATVAGMRQRTRHTFLWIFSWDGEELWTPNDEVVVSSTSEP